MDPLPLVLRELYVKGRQPSTFRLRMACAAAGMGLAVWAFLVFGAAHGNGRWVYMTLLLLAAVLAMSCGIMVAADSVSRERREGTLGLLFLTDLRAADVILGKVAAAAILPTTTLLAFFPGLALCQLMGGVPVAEFWRGIVSLLVLLFFSLAAPMFISTRCENLHVAYGGAAILLLLFNPLWVCLLSLEPVYRLAPFAYWSLLIVFTALGATLLKRACRTLASNWRTSSERWEKRDVIVRAASAAKSLKTAHPLAWMMLRRRAGSRKAWLTLGLPALFGLFLFFSLSGPAFLAACMLLLFAAHAGVYAVALVRTALSFHLDRRDGSLELLLGTRLSTTDLFNGFARCLLEQMKPLLAILVAVDICWSVYFLAWGNHWWMLPATMGGTLWVSVLGLGSTGVYRSLLSDHPAVAMASTVWRLSFFPTGISLLALAGPVANVASVSLFWMISSTFAALFFGLDARSALEKHGRELLLRPFRETPPHIESEWSFIDWDEGNPRSALGPVAAHT